KHDVVEVGHSAEVRIVRGEDVSRADVVGVQLDHPLHRLVEHADEGGDAGSRRGKVALAVGDARAHVEHLVDDRAHRRLAERGEHLVGDRLQRALDDLERDSVSRGLDAHWISILMLPYSSTASSFSGCTTTVLLRDSTIAGPSKLIPASSISPT